MITAHDTHPTLTAYEAAPPLSMWLYANQPKDTMLWRGGFATQAEWMPRMSDYGVHSEPRVVATHRSKSIDLPVPAILLGDPSKDWAVMMLRDNFHDVNVAVVSNVGLTLDLGLVLNEMSRDQYQAAKRRAQAYSGMNKTTAAQWEDGSWYRDWNGGTLIIENGKIWVAMSVFAEGIQRVPGVDTGHYKPGCKGFATFMNVEPDAVIDYFGRLAHAVAANLNG
jgi:hypothetical protein